MDIGGAPNRQSMDSDHYAIQHTTARTPSILAQDEWKNRLITKLIRFPPSPIVAHGVGIIAEFFLEVLDDGEWFLAGFANDAFVG
jgi:hypothetical protein